MNPEAVFVRSGRFAPVKQELTDVKLVAAGPPPPRWCVGTYIRNGPNPEYAPRSKYHWFEGDGMLHAVTLRRDAAGTDKDSEATFRNRWIDHAGFRRNREYGKKHGTGFHYSIFLELQGWAALGSMLTRGALASWLGWDNPWAVGNTANTALAHFRGQTYALVESNPPTKIEVPSLRTLGEETFGGTLKHPMTAHPKVCATTGELVFFSYNLEAPYCRLTSVGTDGTKRPSVDVGFAKPVMIHDFCITPRFAIIFDLPLIFDKKNVVKCKTLFEFDRSAGSFIRLVERAHIADETAVAAGHAQDAFGRHDGALRRVPVRWGAIEPCFVFHFAGAWEADANTIHVVGVKHNDIELDFGRRIARLQSTHQHDLALRGVMTRWTITLLPPGADPTAASISVTEAPVGSTEYACEFPVIHPGRVGKPFRYTWAIANEWPGEDGRKYPLEARGVIKFDLQTNAVVAEQRFENSLVVDEFVFEPTPGAADEDEGVLMGYGTTIVEDRPEDGASEFIMLNARTLDIVCRLPLPQRVPHGFHGIFVAS